MQTVKLYTSCHGTESVRVSLSPGPVTMCFPFCQPLCMVMAGRQRFQCREHFPSRDVVTLAMIHNLMQLLPDAMMRGNAPLPGSHQEIERETRTNLVLNCYWMRSSVKPLSFASLAVICTLGDGLPLTSVRFLLVTTARS